MLGFDRYNVYCGSNGCWPRVVRDDLENPPPSLAGGLVTYPDPRVPMVVRDALCGPAGCGPLLPAYPARALFQESAGSQCGCPSSP
jgi:hypothetical protein